MDIRDLLVRHEKLVHLNEGSNKDGSRPRKQSSAGTAQPPPLSNDSHVDSEMMDMSRAHPQHYHANSMSSVTAPTIAPDPRLPSRAGACNLDLLSYVRGNALFAYASWETTVKSEFRLFMSSWT